MSRTPASNSSDVSEENPVCPLLQIMIDHKRDNDTNVNTALVFIHGVVSCLGILENALILWVVGFRLQRRTVASVWVLNLAMSDFLATLTLPLFTVYLYFNQSWELHTPLCKIQTSIFFINMFVSAFLLAAISLDRCLLVAKPVWSQNRRSVAGAWKVCALGWLWAAVNTFPYFLFRTVTERQDTRKLCYHNFAMYLTSQNMLERDCRIRQESTAISKLFLAFLIPLVVIAGSYILIGFILRNRRRRRKQSVNRLTDVLVSKNEAVSKTANKPTTKSTSISLKSLASGPTLSLTPTSSSLPTSPNQSFTKMVTFVITVFVLCWAPYHIFCIIEVTAHYWRENANLVEIGLPLATTLAFLNPVLNPILYAFSCPDFSIRIRQSLGAVFEGLVEEGRLTVPGKSIRAHMKHKSSRDMSNATPGLPKRPSLPCIASDSQPPFIASLDENSEHTGQKSSDEAK
ncbi:prostaglandin D2 receptor 2-like [Sphaeramia orbicularis]|uniref:Prostaglandin D2 receptor 2-like n=1 Tax=Sphaeramia orbicularis TaxID=375764 RepID=A0A672ZWB8_9TELE|nr:prostaglandin D2 receptor 2-like [Sphaeramia orbicularis]